MSNNRVSFTQTTLQKQAIRDAIAAPEVLLAWRISLGGDRKFAQLGLDGIPWDLKLREYEPVHATHIPGYVTAPNWAATATPSTSLPKSSASSNPSSEDIKDTRAALSNDIYMADLKIYTPSKEPPQRETGHGHRLQRPQGTLPSRTTRQPVTPPVP